MDAALTVKRLTRMRDEIKQSSTVSNRKFLMSTWGRHKGDHKPPAANYCGTAACALGHAAIVPEFRRAGLTLRWHKYNKNWEAEVLYKTNDGYGYYTGHCAGAEFFGITYAEASDLFLTTNRPKKEVIAEINRLIEQYSKAV